MKKILILLSAAALVLVINSCNTVNGLGHDVQKAGGAISTTANKAAN